MQIETASAFYLQYIGRDLVRIRKQLLGVLSST